MTHIIPPLTPQQQYEIHIETQKRILKYICWMAIIYYSKNLIVSRL
jgi:hypothetical protein